MFHVIREMFANTANGSQSTCKVYFFGHLGQILAGPLGEVQYLI